MQLIAQPNRWSCGPAAAAMLCGVSFRQIVNRIGHDGSEIWWPEKEEPQRRRAFHMQEIIDSCYAFGFALVEIIPRAAFEEELRPIYSEDFTYRRLLYYMSRHRGLIFGRYAADRPHMVAWEPPLVYDPNGRIYNLNEDPEPITIDIFYAACRLPESNQR